MTIEQTRANPATISLSASSFSNRLRAIAVGVSSAIAAAGLGGCTSSPKQASQDQPTNMYQAMDLAWNGEPQPYVAPRELSPKEQIELAGLTARMYSKALAREQEQSSQCK